MRSRCRCWPIMWPSCAGRTWTSPAISRRAGRWSNLRQMAGDLYDTDILVWSERQADLLRRLAAGERVNADVDWDNVIDEVETVGRAELNAVESLLLQAMIHLLRLQAYPHDDPAGHWR